MEVIQSDLWPFGKLCNCNIHTGSSIVKASTIELLSLCSFNLVLVDPSPPGAISTIPTPLLIYTGTEQLLI
jgi:hypothetical protein